ncbi:mfs monosaccharide transporter [Ophiostoma piceae UAMH 11346]|uniref:Mfs monosaccharide transporter n=1 Tax=Ophiostoma piceae (strain UAMH 11346) TaxID=1262450 RepID=S3BQX2_OPHP1|nr:mfs monosaccharide transporter [Ophiostoma piceae UAMH 11346]
MVYDASLRYTIGIALFASIGTFLFGYDGGIVTTTIAHQSWVEYMGNPSNGLTGAISATYIAGEVLGSITQIFVADQLGRIRFLEICCVIVTVGCTLQAAAINIGMLLGGRAIAGFAVGGLSCTIPIYVIEISPPKYRGLIGGISGLGMAVGTMSSNWVGFACGFAPYGALQWRLPLGLQIPFGVILFCGLVTFMPHSPRQLIVKGKVDEARALFLRIRTAGLDVSSDDFHDSQAYHEILEEFSLMRAQLQFEKERELSYRDIFKIYRRRVLVSISVQVLTSLTGINVIQYYQTKLYKSLGITSQTGLCLAAVWGTVAVISNVIAVYFLPDRWGRRKMLLTGVGCVILTEIYAAVMQHQFQNTDNKIGKAFAILGIYLFAVAYYGMINSVTWLYGAEILPMAIRNRVMGTAAACHYIVNVGLTEAGPSAFANIKENYYYVFVGCCSLYFVGIYLWYPETKQKTLEEIAAAFGDKVVEVGANEMAAEELAMEGGAKAGLEKANHIERA